MSAEKYLYHLNYNFDYNKLKSYVIEEEFEPFESEYYGHILDFWKIKRIKNDDYINSIKTDLNLEEAHPRFYILKKGHELETHKDEGTECAINVILSDNPEPIIINGIKYYYKSALIDVSQNHSINESDHDRVLFKLTIKDKTFQQVKNILISNNYII